ncbi:MAG: hypothetical protein IPK53_19520 [bacterium]|nr:hypothetical protein [bacterium]
MALAGVYGQSWLLLAGEVPGVLDAQGRVVAAIPERNDDEVCRGAGRLAGYSGR